MCREADNITIKLSRSGRWPGSCGLFQTVTSWAATQCCPAMVNCAKFPLPLSKDGTGQYVLGCPRAWPRQWGCTGNGAEQGRAGREGVPHRPSGWGLYRPYWPRDHRVMMSEVEGTFSEAFFSSLSMIWATELGDKTFFIAVCLCVCVCAVGGERAKGPLDVTDAVRQAVAGGCQSGWGQLLSGTNAIEAGTCRQGDSAWA